MPLKSLRRLLSVYYTVQLRLTLRKTMKLVAYEWSRRPVKESNGRDTSWKFDETSTRISRLHLYLACSFTHGRSLTKHSLYTTVGRNSNTEPQVRSRGEWFSKHFSFTPKIVEVIIIEYFALIGSTPHKFVPVFNPFWSKGYLCLEKGLDTNPSCMVKSKSHLCRKNKEA